MPAITQEQIDNRGVIGICCEGCNRVTVNFRCNAFLEPEDKWAHGGCGLASHLKRVEVKKGKVRVGQQKQQFKR